MSNDNGIAPVIDASAKAALKELSGYAGELHQFDFLDPVTSEEILEAREALGPNAGSLALVARVRERRRGRPAKAKNRNTADLIQYLSQFGPDPAVAAMKIIATTEEVMVERSKQIREKISNTDNKIEFTYGMTFEAAQNTRLRAIDLMMPYFHAKKPVAVDLTAHGDFNLLLPGQNISESDAQKMAEGTFQLGYASYDYLSNEADDGNDATPDADNNQIESSTKGCDDA